MKFGDIVTSVACAMVIYALIMFPLLWWTTRPEALDLYWGIQTSTVISLLLSALITGYIFGEKIQEARMESIGKITVLTAAFTMILAVASVAATADWTPWVKEAYQEMNPGVTLSTIEWMQVEAIALMYQVSFNVAMVLVLGFIGLYVGSTLKKMSEK